MQKNKKRILFLHTLPSPYRTPLFEKFANDSEIDTTVFFMAKGAKNRIWDNGEIKFKHKFLPSFTLNLKQKDDIILIWNNPTIPYEIFKGNFDLVICSGWDSIGTFLSRITCAILRIPMIIWSGSTLNEKSWRRSLMRIPVKLLINSCSALVTYGEASKKYLQSFGVNSKKIFIAHNSVDIDYYKKISFENFSKRTSIKNKLGIKNKYLVLFVGQFITRKGMKDLYNAIKILNKKIDVGILWVGHGPLEQKIKELGIKDNFKSQYFAKTHNQKETAKLYAIADIFALPTYEDLYSNVVPEALESGLPVITTKENGANFDYIKSEKNGFVINSGDVKTLEQKLRLLLEDDKLRNKMSNITWNLIKKFNYNENIKSFKNAMKYALKIKHF